MTEKSQTFTVAQPTRKQLKLAEKYERILDRAKTMRRRHMEMRVFEDDMEAIIAALYAAQPPASPVAQGSSVLSQHIGWMKQYILAMDESNWRDMRLQIRAQLDALSADLAPQPPAAPVETVKRRDEADAYFKILQTIARFPITDPKNMDAVNMRLIAEGAVDLATREIAARKLEEAAKSAEAPHPRLSAATAVANCTCPFDGCDPCPSCAGNAHTACTRPSEDDCPGHVASADDPRVCGRCGVHIDSLRPDTEQS